MEQDEKIRIELLTPLSADFTEDYWSRSYLDKEEIDDEEDGSYPLDGVGLVPYKEAIQEMVDQYNALGSKDGSPCNLMQYYSDNPVISQKVESAVVSVKEADGVLYGCTTLILNDFLESDEMKELCEYITGQYSDGWGEGFEQRDIEVDGGTLNVHFWQSGNFPMREVAGEISQKTEHVPDQTSRRPKLKLLGHDGNIFSIMGDAARLLKEAGQGKEAEEMIKRVQDSGDYYKALGIVSEYVETELSRPVASQTREITGKKTAKEDRGR